MERRGKLANIPYPYPEARTFSIRQRFVQKSSANEQLAASALNEKIVDTMAIDSSWVESG